MISQKQLSSHAHKNIYIFLAGLFCSFGYLVLALHPNSVSNISIFNFLGIYWFLGAIVGTLWIFLNRSGYEISIKTVLLWGVIFRLIGVTGSPILEDDFFRYLLDGCVFAQESSPYGITPQSLFIANNLSTECRAALDWVNNPDLPTIYAPVLQYLFLLAYYISPGNVDVLQLILVGFDMVLILLMSKYIAPKYLLLYAWNPLIIKEIAFTAHPDIIGVLFLFCAFIARYHGKLIIASIMIGLACATKIFAILLLPWFIYRQPARAGAIIACTVLLAYSPFLLQGQTDLLVLGVFAERWQFNATGFLLAQQLMPDFIARVACLSLFVTWMGYYFFKFHQHYPNNAIPRVEWIFGIFLFISPVVNAWYLIWLLPFAALSAGLNTQLKSGTKFNLTEKSEQRLAIWPWATSISISLSYVVGLHLEDSDLGAYAIAPWAYFLQLGMIIAAICIDIRNNQFRLTRP